MALVVEDIVDGTVGGKKALGRALRFEPLLLALAPADRKVPMLRPLVLAQAARMMALALVEIAGGNPI
jgi:hypothetical protein